jgi:hypothetical protein
VRRMLSTTGLVIGAAWSLLMFLTLGQGIVDADPAVIVYAASGSVVSGWGVWLSVRRRRGQADRDWLPVVACTAASLLGPLAFILLAAHRVRALVFERVPRSEPEPLAVEPSRASSVYAPGQTTTEPMVYRPSSVYARPRTPPRPTRTLAWQLILAVLAFLVVGVFILGFIAFGNTVVTPHVMRNIALGSGAVSGAAILGAAFLWFGNLSRAEHAGSRLPGLVMIGAAATLVTGATVYFGTLTSPRNVERPSVSGPPHLFVKAVLTADPGRWNEPDPSLIFSYQWQDCDSSCDAIFDATAQTYVVQEADVGQRLRVAVEADARHPGWRELASGLAYSSETARVTR